MQNNDAIEVNNLITKAEPKYDPLFSGCFIISLMITLSSPNLHIIEKKEMIDAP